MSVVCSDSPTRRSSNFSIPRQSVESGREGKPIFPSNHKSALIVVDDVLLTLKMSRILTSTLRAAARPAFAPRMAATATPSFSQVRFSSSEHQETFESFSNRYVSFFSSAQDLFEVQRGLNNCFAHDLVPSPEVIEAALRAARRVDDYATAVRVFEGIKEKVENKQQYEAYLAELKPVREELGQFHNGSCSQVLD